MTLAALGLLALVMDPAAVDSTCDTLWSLTVPLVEFEHQEIRVVRCRRLTLRVLTRTYRQLQGEPREYLPDDQWYVESERPIIDCPRAPAEPFSPGL